jgi:hypothetical protein
MLPGHRARSATSRPDSGRHTEAAGIALLAEALAFGILVEALFAVKTHRETCARERASRSARYVTRSASGRTFRGRQAAKRTVGTAGEAL